MKKTKKAILKSTGEKIDVIEEHGVYWDKKQSQIYLNSELQFIHQKHQFQVGFHICRFGFYLFVREYLKYKTWFLIPGVLIDYIKGSDFYIDLELRFLFFGIGFRFIWLKNWTCKIPLKKIFKK